MTLDVHTTPGFVLVTCGSETVVVAGVLVAPPGAGLALPISVGPGAPTTWIPSTGQLPPAVREPGGKRPPPKMGAGGGGVSSQVVKSEISERFVSLALSGAHVDIIAPKAVPLDKLLASQVFIDFNGAMSEPYALTVSPKAGTTVMANSASVVIGDMAPSVLTKNWIPNV